MNRFDEINDSFDKAMLPLKGALRAIEVFSESISELLRPINENAVKLGEMLLEAFKPFAAARKLGEAQYVYWDYIESDFADSLIKSKNTNEILCRRNETDEYRTVGYTISSCSGHTLIAPYSLFAQSILAYSEGKYDLAVLGLLSVIDGLLTDVSENDTTSIFKRTESIIKRAENNEILDANEVALIMLSITFQKTVEIISAKSDFSKGEPNNLNRHWIMHGRSRHKKTKLDCVKLINFIYGILLINDYADLEVSDI